MENFLSATAVTKLDNGDFLLAADQEGIFVKVDDEWVKTVHLPEGRVLDLKNAGEMVYGVGDTGLFLRSQNGGRNWAMKRFHTTSTMWSVSCNEEGLVITHSDKALYLSKDFGENWKVIKPFHFCKYPPSIRSLCLHGDELFIGTKIHAKNGGIWRLHLKTGEIRKIKEESQSMIASMGVSDNLLLAACGSCRGNDGKIIFCELKQLSETLAWKECTNEQGEACYLDLCCNKDVFYTTSSKNKNGKGRIYRIFLQEQKVVPFGEVNGHGWRIVNQEEEFVVAGLYESFHYKKIVN